MKNNLRKLISGIGAAVLGLALSIVLPNATLPNSALLNPAHADPGGIERPTIIPREVWGAREPRCEWAGQDGNRVTHVVIHHSYEPTDPPSLESAYAAIRHIQNLHMDDNGWCDVGYSYLVDWFGNVYEGTRGTIDRPITSAHTAGLNFEGVGIVMIGNYQEEIPSAQTVAAAGRVAGWVLGWYGYDAEQDVQLTVGGSNNKWSSGTRITVPAITAHRDVVTTECPGDGGYSVLDAIRAEAATISAAMHASGDFNGGTGNSSAIFAVGEPSYPIGADAQDTEEVAEAAGLEVAGSEPADHATHEPMVTAEPDDGPATSAEEPAVAPEGSGGRTWWLPLIGIALLGGVWYMYRRTGRNAVSGAADEVDRL